jgi:voltage-gated potassium channel
MRFSPRSWLNTGLGKLLIFISLLLVLSSWGFYLVELRPTGHRDFLAAVWWAVVTLTTVGYGDIVPATPAGRVLGLLVMISGIGMVSTLTGNLASLLVEQKAKKRKGLLKVRLSGHVVILGWNSHARTLISSLKASGVLERSDVALVNTLPAEERENITYQFDLGDKLHFVYGDPTLKNVLDRASPETAKMAYVLSQDGLDPKEADQQSLYAVLTLRSIASKLPIYAEVVLEGDQEHLIRAGVNETVIRGEISSLVLAGMGKSPVVWPFFRRLIGAEGNLLDFRRLTSEEKKGSWGEFLAKANRESGVLPVALCQEAKAVSLEDILDQGEALDSFIIELFTASGRKTELGQQMPGVLVNPAYGQSMQEYDGILFLKPGEARQA